MTRDEALRRLRTTDDFELRDGLLVVRSVRLLAAIEHVRRQGSHEAAPGLVDRRTAIRAA